MKGSTLLVLALSCLTLNAQEPALNGDCKDAVQLKPSGNTFFTSSPKGHGSELEISGNPLGSLKYIQQEHNTAWFWFDAVSEDLTVFKIYPTDTKADFDFMLFEYSDENFCADVKSQKIEPIRSNISRNDPFHYSATGLSVGSDEPFVRSGKGSHLSKAIKPTKGQRYYLLLDNENGIDSSFTIQFNYYKKTIVEGVVKDEESGEPIGGANVSWEEEKTGEVLAETTSDPETGEYRMEAPVRISKAKRNYIQATSSDEHFFEEKVVSVKSVDQPIKLTSILPKLRKGKKMTLRNILFHGGKAIPLASSKPSFKRLHKLMRANRHLNIKIEGHTNGCPGGVERSQLLSENRAKCVKDYLTDRKVSPQRIETIGYNCTRMIPKPPDYPSDGGGHNRRVEFIVTNY